MNNGNSGNGHLTLRTFLMISGLVLTIALGVATMFGTRTSAIEDNMQKIIEEMGDRGERISTLEAQTASIHDFITDQKDFNKRIEAKIDMLIRR